MRFTHSLRVGTSVVQRLARQRAVRPVALSTASGSDDSDAKRPARGGGAFRQRRVRASPKAAPAVDSTGIVIPASEIKEKEKANADMIAAQEFDEVDLGTLWEKRTDAASGNAYHFHPVTSQTTWVHPSQGIVPAKLPRRMAAAAIDLTLAMTVGVVVGMEVAWEMSDQNFQQAFTMFGVVVSFVSRDALFEDGTRSIGKRLLKLEILDTAEGEMSQRGQNIKRNVYSSLNPLMIAASPFHLVVMACDLVLIAFNMKGRRSGDWMAKTVVVDELPERAARMEHRAEMFKQNARAEALNTQWKRPPGQLALWAEDQTDASSWTFNQEREAHLPSGPSL